MAAPELVRRFSRVQGFALPLAGRVLVDCWRSGARPNEALVWRQFFSPPGPHPLPGRAAGVLLSQLGNPAEHRLLADKQATADLLSAAGLPTPPLLAVIPAGAGLDAGTEPWTEPGQLFVKPRYGAAGRGAMAIDVLARDLYRIGAGTPLASDALRARLRAASRYDLLVQARLVAKAELVDLSVAGAAPVLRLSIARRPNEDPMLHSALLSIDVPGEQPHNFIRGQLRVPVDPNSGRMGQGIWFLHPGERYDSLPWNQACLAGRVLPDFEAAVQMVLRAMALLPGLALVNWDLILAPQGPVILEGNTGGDWILTRLASLQGMESFALVPLLQLWTRAAGALAWQAE